MFIPIDGGEGWSLTKEEEEAFGVGLRRALIHDRPNPKRIGCPDQKILRDLASHKKIGDAEAFERITNHLAECSPCVQDAIVYAELYKGTRKRRHTAFLVLGLVAAVVLSVGIWAMWHLQATQETAGNARSLPIPTSSGSATRDAGNRPETPPQVAQLEPVVIQLPPRLRGPSHPTRPIVLKRGNLQLEIRLPIGSPKGTYKLRILNKSGKVQKSVEATANSVGAITTLNLAVDTTPFSPGDYTLSILQPGVDEWSDYPFTVR